VLSNTSDKNTLQTGFVLVLVTYPLQASAAFGYKCKTGAKQVQSRCQLLFHGSAEKVCESD
jgi:hypothetical protein